MVLTSQLSATSYPRACHPNTLSAAARGYTHLEKYLSSPLHAPSVAAFERTLDELTNLDAQGSSELIIDSGCGLGRSTRLLAEQNPEAIVVGIDRSEQRLRKGSGGGIAPRMMPPNALLVQAELATFWRLMLQQEELVARVSKHHVLYPNPYPKPRRLNLRWHGHPALPVLLSIGDTIELRSNWEVYLEEFRAAADVVSQAAVQEEEEKEQQDAEDEEVTPAYTFARSRLASHAAAAASTAIIEEVALEEEEDALTSFERNYFNAGEATYRLVLPSSSSTSSSSTTIARPPRARPRHAPVGMMMMGPWMGPPLGPEEAEELQGRLEIMYEEKMGLEARLEAMEEELQASRQLYSEDVTNLEAQIDELESRLELGAAGGAPLPEEEVALLQSQLDAERMRADAGELAAADAKAELEAVRELAAQDEEERVAELVEVREELLAAEKELAATKLGEGEAGGAAEAAAAEVEELKEQVAELLTALEQSEAAMGEFMALRVRAAELEAKLEEAQKRKPQADESKDKSADDE